MGLSTTYTKVETDFLIQQLEEKTSNKYNDESNSTANDVIKFIDINTGEDVNYRETTTWYDGSVMNDSKVDGVIFIKKGSKYYLRQYTGSINVKWFGAKGDGVTDDTMAIQKAFDFGYKNRNINIVLDKGIFVVTNTLFFPARCTLSGSGMNESVLRMYDIYNKPLIEIKENKESENTIATAVNSIYTRFTEFSLHGTNWNANYASDIVNPLNCGILVKSMVKVDFDRLTIRGFAGHGIFFNEAYYLKINNINAEWNAISGLYVKDSTSVHSVNCEFRFNGKGVYLEHTYAWSFVNPLIESNVLSFITPFTHDAVIADSSSIGFAIKDSFNGQISGGYFEEQLVGIMYDNSTNINVIGTFLCNLSSWQQPPNFIPSQTIYLRNQSHQNSFKNNSYLAENNANDIRTYLDATCHGLYFEFNKKQHLDLMLTNFSWLWDNFRTNGIIEKSPKLVSLESNEQYVYGKRIQIGEMYYGSTTDRPTFATTGFQYLNTDTSKVEVKIGNTWIELN